MANEIRLPVKIEVLQNSLQEVQRVLNGLQPNTKAYRDLERIFGSMKRELDSIQIASSKPFVDQKQFTGVERSINKIENGLDNVRLVTSRINFSDLKLTPEQTAVFEGFKQQIEESKKSVIEFKNQLKTNLFSDVNTATLLKDIDPTLVNKNFDAIVKAVDTKTKQVNKAYQDAKDSIEKYQTQIATGQKVDKLLSHDNVISKQALGADFDKFFKTSDEGKLTFQKGQRNNFIEYMKEQYTLSDKDVELLKTRNAEQIKKLLNSEEGQNTVFGSVQRSSANAQAKLPTAQVNAVQSEGQLKNLITLNNNLHVSQQQVNNVEREARDIQSRAAQAAREYGEALAAGYRNTQDFKSANLGLNDALKTLRSDLQKTNTSFLKLQQTQSNFQAIKMAITNFMGFHQVLNLVKRGIKEAISTIRELDLVMTKISVVTDMTNQDLWGQIDSYSALAGKYGTSIKGAYEISQIYYQQGLKTKEVLTLTEETLKLAKISGLDYATTTDYMTTAIRGFKMEMTEASRVVDVYSNLAAHTAVTQEELAVAMSKTASSLESVGASFEESSAMIATMVAVTRESATNIGSALKSIASRYGELKSDPLKMTDLEGEELSYNKVDTALKSIGISLKDDNGQFRNMTDVIVELSSKWDQLESTQQRYIATQFAGNRQQSRFLALVSNKDLLQENLRNAEEAEGVGELQVGKALDDLDTKINRLKISYQEFYTSMNLEGLFGGVLNLAKNVLDTFSRIPKIGIIPLIYDIISTIKLALNSALSGIARVWEKLMPTSQNAGAETGEGFVKSFKESITNAIAAFKDAGKSAGQAIGEGINEGQAAVQPRAGLATDTASLTKDLAGTQAGMALTAGIGNLSIDPSATQEQVGTMMNEIVTNVQTQFGGLKEVFANYGADTITQYLNNLLQFGKSFDATPIGVAIGESIRNGLVRTNLLEVLTQQLETNGIDTVLQEKFSHIDLTASQDDLLNQVSGILQNVSGEFSGLKDMMANASDDAIAGYINRLLARQTEVQGVSRTIGLASIEGLREGIDAHSDSVEAGEAADDTVNGFIHRIEDRLQDAVKNGRNLGQALVQGLREELESGKIDSIGADALKEITTKMNAYVRTVDSSSKSAAGRRNLVNSGFTLSNALNGNISDKQKEMLADAQTLAQGNFDNRYRDAFIESPKYLENRTPDNAYDQASTMAVQHIIQLEAKVVPSANLEQEGKEIADRVKQAAEQSFQENPIQPTVKVPTQEEYLAAKARADAANQAVKDFTLKSSVEVEQAGKLSDDDRQALMARLAEERQAVYSEQASANVAFRDIESRMPRQEVPVIQQPIQSTQVQSQVQQNEIINTPEEKELTEEETAAIKQQITALEDLKAAKQKYNELASSNYGTKEYNQSVEMFNNDYSKEKFDAVREAGYHGELYSDGAIDNALEQLKAKIQSTKQEISNEPPINIDVSSDGINFLETETKDLKSWLDELKTVNIDVHADNLDKTKGEAEELKTQFETLKETAEQLGAGEQFIKDIEKDIDAINELINKIESVPSVSTSSEGSDSEESNSNEESENVVSTMEDIGDHAEEAAQQVQNLQNQVRNTGAEGSNLSNVTNHINQAQEQAEQSISVMDRLKASVQAIGQKGAASITGFGSALRMIATLFDKSNKTGKKLAGVVTIVGAAVSAVGIAIQIVDKQSKAAAASNPWMAIAMAIMAVVSGISMLFETNEDRMKELEDAAEKAHEAAQEARADYKTLDSSTKKLKELEKARYDSAESAQEYQTAVDELADKFPDLIKAYDESGNAIIDMIDLENQLAETRKKSAESTLKEQEASAIVTYTKMQQILTDLVGTMESLGVTIFENYGSSGGTGAGAGFGKTLTDTQKQTFNRIFNKDGTIDLFNRSNSNAALIGHMMQTINSLDKAGDVRGVKEALDFLNQLLDYMSESSNSKAKNLANIIQSDNKFLSFNKQINSAYNNYESLKNGGSAVSAFLTYRFGEEKFMQDKSGIGELIARDIGRRYAEASASGATPATSAAQWAYWQLDEGNNFYLPNVGEQATKFWEEYLTESQQKRFTEMASQRDKYTGMDILREFNLDKDHRTPQVYQAYYELIDTIEHSYDETNEKLKERLQGQVDQVRTIMSKVDSTGGDTKYGRMFVNQLQENIIDAETQISSDLESVLNNMIKTYQTLLSRTPEQADKFAKQARNLWIKTYYDLPNELSSTIYDILEKNGFTVEGIDKSLHEISQIDNDEYAEILLDVQQRLQQIRSNMITYYGIAIETLSQEFLTAWETNVKEIKSLSSGMTYSDALKWVNKAIAESKLTEHDLLSDLTLSDLEISKGQFTVPVEKIVDYLNITIENYEVEFERFSQELENELQLIETFKLEDGTWDYGKMGASSGSSGVYLDELEKMAEEMGIWSDYFFNDEAHGGVIKVIGQTEDERKTTLNNLMEALEQKLKENKKNNEQQLDMLIAYRQQVGYELLKLGDFTAIYEALGKEINTNHEALAELKQYASKKKTYTGNNKDVVSTISGIQSSYASFLSDILSKGYENIDWTKYSYLSKEELDLGKVSYLRYIQEYGQFAGKTLEEINALIQQAIEKDTDTAINGLKDLKFISYDQFSGSLTAVKDFANRFGLELNQLIEDGIAYYDQSLGEYIVNWRKIQDINIENAVDNYYTSVAENMMKNDSRYKTIGSTVERIAELVQLIDQANNEINQANNETTEARINQYKEELRLAENILQIRSTTEDSSFKFMSGKIPGAQNNPINYMNDWVKAFTTIDDSTTNGFMDYSDFYNIVDQMAQLSSYVGEEAIQVGNDLYVNATTVHDLIDSAALAMRIDPSDGKYKIDMSALAQLGIDFSKAGKNAKKQTTEGIKAFAAAQVDMLDTMIQMLEVVVKMEEYEEVFGEDHEIDFSQAFTLSDDSTDQYKLFDRQIRDMLESFETIDNEDFQNALNQMTWNGKSFYQWMTDALQGTLNENDAKNFVKVLNSLYKMSLSNTYDLEELYKSLVENAEETDLIVEMFTSDKTKTILTAGGRITVKLDENDYEYNGYHYNSWQELNAARFNQEYRNSNNSSTITAETGITVKGYTIQFSDTAKPYVGEDGQSYNTPEEALETFINGDLADARKMLIEEEIIITPILSVDSSLTKEQSRALKESGIQTGQQLLDEWNNTKNKIDFQVKYGFQLDESQLDDENYLATLNKLLNSEIETKKVETELVAANPNDPLTKVITSDEEHPQKKTVLLKFKMIAQEEEGHRALENVISEDDSIEATVENANVEAQTCTLYWTTDGQMVVVDENGEVINQILIENLFGIGYGTLAARDCHFTYLPNAGKVQLQFNTPNGQVTVTVPAEKLQGTGLLTEGNCTATLDEDLQLHLSGDEVHACTVNLNDEGVELEATGTFDESNATYKFESSGAMTEITVTGVDGKVFHTTLNTPITAFVKLAFVLSKLSKTTPDITDDLGIEKDLGKLADIAATIGININYINNNPDATLTVDGPEIIVHPSGVTQATGNSGFTNLELANIGGGGSPFANYVLDTWSNPMHVRLGWAKGNVALSKGTLMGELGPELVVSNGKYYVVGQVGPEFVNLPDDAIVFNHLQTQSLLNKGKSKQRGVPTTNEQKAVSYAKGNINGGPAMASAKDALNALKELRSQWQAIAQLNAEDFAKKGGGGGGGNNKDNAFIKSLERWYNILQKIASLEEQITEEQTKRAKIVAEFNRSGKEYYNSQKVSIKQLQEEARLQKELATEQQAYFNKRLQEMNDSSNPFSQLYTIDESGQLKYKKGGYELLAQLTAQDQLTHQAKYSVKEQYQQLIDWGFGEYLQYNANGEKIDTKDDAGLKSALEAFWAKIDADQSEMQGLHDSIVNANKTELEKLTAMYEEAQKIEENQLAVEERVMATIENMEQRVIDEQQKERDAIEKSNNALIKGLTDQLSLEKKMYETQQSENELESKRRRLAILQRSGGSASEINALQQEINTASQDLYFNKQQEQIDAIQTASDLQIEKLDAQISLMTETLEYEKANGLLWERVYEQMAMTPEEITNFISQNNDEFWGKSLVNFGAEVRDVQFEAEQWRAFAEEDGISGIKGLVEKIAEQISEEEILNANAPVEATGLNANVLESVGKNITANSNNTKTKWAVRFDKDTDRYVAYQSATGNHNSYSEAVKERDEKNAKEGKSLVKAGASAAELARYLTSEGKYTEQTQNALNIATEEYGEEAMGGEISNLLLKNLKAPGAASGAIVDRSGIARIHDNEVILTADQTRFLKDSILSNKSNSLLSLVTDLQSAYSNAATNAIHTNDNGIIIENATVEMNVSRIANDYDAQRAGEQALDKMLQIARKTSAQNRIG